MRLRNPMLVLASIGFFACGGQAADDIGFHYPECVGTAGDTIDVGVVNAGSMELSGLAAMRTDASILWTFGDSGNPAELYALDPATGMPANGSSDVSITNVANFDWEDIATAPCSAGECIYIADTGDNDLVRNNVTIYEVVPPGPIAARFVQTYADGPHNLEALFIDERDASSYGISKVTTGDATIFMFPRAEATNVPVVIGNLTIPTGDNRVTAADMRVDACSARILVRTRTNVFGYFGPPETAVADLFAQAPIELTAPAEPQGEAIAWSADGRAYFTISEGASPTLHRVDFK